MKRDLAEPAPVSALPLFAQPARPAEVLAVLKPHLDAAGVALHVAAGKLHYTAPTGRMSDALRDLLRRHREDLIAALAQTATEQAITVTPQYNSDPAPVVMQRENNAAPAGLVAALPVIQAKTDAAPDLAAVEAALRARIFEAEDRIARGETLLQTETDPARAARYRARLAELTDQVNACYDQIGALPIDWPFPGGDA